MFIRNIVNVQNVRKTTKTVNWFVLILLASCQTSPGTCLEYPQHILLEKIRSMRLFLKLSILGHFWAFLGHFWACTDHLEPKYPRVGTLNLCQKMTDKNLKDSWQYVHSDHSKRPKCQKNNENGQFWAHFWHFLGSVQLICPDSFCILSDISWDRFRVPTTHSFEKK